MSMQTEDWEPISPFQDVETQGIASNLSHRINLPKSFALENQPNPMLGRIDEGNPSLFVLSVYLCSSS